MKRSRQRQRARVGSFIYAVWSSWSHRWSVFPPNDYFYVCSPVVGETTAKKALALKWLPAPLEWLSSRAEHLSEWLLLPFLPLPPLFWHVSNHRGAVWQAAGLKGTKRDWGSPEKIKVFLLALLLLLLLLLPPPLLAPFWRPYLKNSLPNIAGIILGGGVIFDPRFRRGIAAFVDGITLVYK